MNYSGDSLLAEQKFYENGALVDTIRIVRDGMLALQDRDGENAIVSEYTWGLNLGGGIGGLLNLKTAGQNYAYLYDGKGNVEALLDKTESVVAAYRYDPFGVLLAKTGSFEQPYGFSTKRSNAPVGMVQYEFRNYFPEIARWDSRDPLGEAGGINLYAFVGNNPINWYDPSGLVPQKFSPYLNSIQKTFYEGIASGKIAETITLLEEIGMAGATKYINQAKQLLNTLTTLIHKYPPSSFKCDTLATKIYDAFKAVKASPQIIEITDKYFAEKFFTDKGLQFANSGYHHAVSFRCIDGASRDGL